MFETETTGGAPATAEERFEVLSQQVGWLVARQRKQDELFSEMAPIAREVVATVTSRLDAAEKRGWFAFARELAGVARRVLDHYSAEDVRALGESVVSILDTVRSMTQPEVLAIAGETARALDRTEQAQPIGLTGMVRASRNADVQKGMAVLLELLGNVGRAAQVMVERGSPEEGRRARLARMLGPRRVTAASAAPSPPVPNKASGATTVIDGVAFKPDGHIADPSAWTRALAENIAAIEQVPLNAERWKLVDLARAEYLERKAAPNIRRLTEISGLSTREIFARFPKAPGRTIARIAGTPKPAGCI